MNKLSLLLLFLSLSFIGTAQESENSIKFHSISFAPLNVYFSDRDAGFGMNVDVAVKSGKHIFKIYAGGASEFAINFGGNTISDSFGEIDLLYGRELEIKKWFGIDFFAGVGYFNFSYDQESSNQFKKDVIGFPVQSKIRFKPGRTFSMGVQIHSNINGATTIFQPGLFLQWNLNNL